MPGRKLRPAALALALALLLTACSGGGEGAAPPTGDLSSCVPGGGENYVHRAPEGDIVPVTISSDLAVGENRFVLGLLNADNEPVTGADLTFRFFCFNGAGEKVYSAPVEPRPITITRSYTHTHEDGTVESHEAGETGVYVAEVDFPVYGRWGVTLTGRAAGHSIGRMDVVFPVNEKPYSPAVGDPAPKSVQPTLADVPDISQLDTSASPIPEMHDKTIAEAVTSGRPTVIVFATPAFCQSQICGPVKDIVDDLYAAYRDRANFVHVEPYDVARLRDGSCRSLNECVQPVMSEWGLRTEPWVFIVDSGGNVAAKFEGLASYTELEAALLPLLD
jgi:hypothetical protein